MSLYGTSIENMGSEEIRETYEALGKGTNDCLERWAAAGVACFVTLLSEGSNDTLTRQTAGAGALGLAYLLAHNDAEAFAAQARAHFTTFPEAIAEAHEAALAQNEAHNAAPEA